MRYSRRGKVLARITITFHDYICLRFVVKRAPQGRAAYSTFRPCIRLFTELPCAWWASYTNRKWPLHFVKSHWTKAAPTPLSSSCSEHPRRRSRWRSRPALRPVKHPQRCSRGAVESTGRLNSSPLCTGKGVSRPTKVGRWYYTGGASERSHHASDPDQLGHEAFLDRASPKGWTRDLRYGKCGPENLL